MMNSYYNQIKTVEAINHIRFASRFVIVYGQFIIIIIMAIIVLINSKERRKKRKYEKKTCNK